MERPETHRPGARPPQPAQARSRPTSRGWRLFNTCIVRPTALCGWSLLFLTPLLALAIGLFYVRLIYSPISVDFLAEPIERALNAELSDLAVDIEGAVLHRSARGGIELRLRKLGLQDRRGARIGEAAWAGVEVNLKGLLNGRLAPSRIVLIEPRILLEKKSDGRIAVSMRGDETSAPGKPSTPGPIASQPERGGAAQPAPEQNPGSDTASPPVFDIGRMMSEALDQMRPDGSGASALQAIGLRDASLTLDSDGGQTTWRVLELDVDLKQKQKRRIVSGRGRIATTGEPWSLSFRAEASQKAGTLTLTADITDATPGALVRDMPSLRVLERLDVPVTARSTFDLSPAGDLLGSTIAVDIGRGWLALTETETVPVGAGRIEARYSGETGRLEILPSRLELAGGQITIAGIAEPRDISRPSREWRFEIASTRPLDGDAGARPLIDSLSVRGGVLGAGGGAAIEALKIKAGGAELTASGRVGGNGAGSSLELTGQIAPIQASALGAAWPEAIAPEQRALILKRLLKGNVVGRNFRLSTSSGNGDAPPKLQLAMTVEAYDVEMRLSERLPPLELPRLLLRIDGGSLEATAPDAQMTFPGSRKISGKGVRLTAVSVDGSTPMAELVLRASAPLPAVVELMEREPGALKDVGKIPPGLDGKVETSLRIAFPLSSATRATDVRYEASSRISDGRWRDAIGQLDVSGASIAIESNERTAEAKGELLLAGVNVKVAGQWLADPPEGRQPPIRFTTKLDRADRTQLGLDMEHMISGEVPVEVTIQSGGTEPAKINFGADLTNAEITISDVFWTKPIGQAARMQFDVIRGPAKALELQSFKLVGHNIAIEGSVSIGPDGKPKEYNFPEFALNVVTHLGVKGRLRPDRIWEVTARGKTFDGRDFFKSLFSLGGDVAPSAKPRPGVDLDIQIETVLGISDVNLKNVRLLLQQRLDRNISLDLTGTLEGGKKLAATIRSEQGRGRVLTASTDDAGQAMKLIGFYQNMTGGSGEIDVLLDARGATERSGQAQIRRFSVLGDPVVAEVLQSADESRPAIDQGTRGRRRIVREQFDFDTLTARVAVGNGQIAIEDMIVKGPLIGASVRGKMDFRSRRMHLGGTYVPLSSLNRALSGIPLVGLLLTGPRGEGIFGITFAVEGSMAEPNVLVNPLSLVTVGVLREIFQMVPENPRISPKEQSEPRPVREGGPQIRASPPTGSGTANRPQRAPEVLDGWSATSKKK